MCDIEQEGMIEMNLPPTPESSKSTKTIQFVVKTPPTASLGTVCGI